MKKVITGLFAFFFALCVATPPTVAAYDESNTPEFTISSPEFPDAYVITDQITTYGMDGTEANSIVATVFVEEVYSLSDDNQTITTESRLL